jgi:hypothetical protein
MTFLPDWITGPLTYWLGWVGIGVGSIGLIVLAVFLIFGGPVLLSILKMLEPIGTKLSEGVAWLMSAIGAGLKDILEDWTTILTVVLGGFILWSYIQTDAMLERRALTRDFEACRAELTTAKVELSKARPKPRVIRVPQRSEPEPASKWTFPFFRE